MCAWLCATPVPNSAPRNGASTCENSDGRGGCAAGIPASACANSGFVDGCVSGGGGWPASIVVWPTLGVTPRVGREPSSRGVAGGGGWLPVAGVVGGGRGELVGLA